MKTKITFGTHEDQYVGVNLRPEQIILAFSSYVVTPKGWQVNVKFTSTMVYFTEDVIEQMVEWLESLGITPSIPSNRYYYDLVRRGVSA